MPTLDPKMIFGIFLILVVGWTLIWLWIMLRAKIAVSYSEIAPKAAKVRKKLFYVSVLILAVVFVISMYWLPYPVARTVTVGEPTKTIMITAEQWQWTVNDTTITKGTVVKFILRSADVNHGFGLYDSDGTLLTQAQVVPGYDVTLIWKFDQAGRYTIWCLEYCGINHHAMTAVLTVT